MEKKETAQKLLVYYYIWGGIATMSFIFFLVLLACEVMSKETGMALIFSVLICGFVWIGSTAVSRHAFITLKQFMGKEVGTLEFISTQLIVFFFPLVYTKVKKEVEQFEKESSEKKQAGS